MAVNDLSGQVFERLTVINQDLSKTRTYWNCFCECDKTKIISIRADNLILGKSRSCGCYHKDKVSEKGLLKKYNEVKLKDNHMEVYTSKGEIILIDQEDYEIIKNYCWSIGSNGYPFARDCAYKNKPILLHRLVMKPNKKDIVDHINHNLLDSRKSNLRLCTPSQNMANQKLSKRNTSGYKGVYWSNEKNEWYVKIGWNNKQLNGGYFKDIQEAITKRDNMEKQYFGDFRYMEGEVNDEL